jgi:branched-chain amino acid transport system substrate-binding protein
MKKIMMMISILALLVLAACSTTPTSNVASVSEDPIKVGVSVPLSGGAASWGLNALAGIQVATNEINAQGGINGRQVELVVEDDTCSAQGVNAINKLVNIDQVDALIGPVCSAVGGPALPNVASRNVPTIIFASAPHLTSLGDNIFRTYPSDAFAGKFTANFMHEELDIEKVAVIYVKNDWGEAIQRVFQEEFIANGGDVVYSTGVLQTDSDFKTEIEKIKNSGAQAVYVPIYPENAVPFLKQAQELGLDIPLVDGDGFSGEEITRSGYADGIIYSIGKTNEPEVLKQKVSELPGYENLEVNFMVPIANDAANTLFSAIETAGTTENGALIAALKATYIPGQSTSFISFDEVGDLEDVSFETFTVVDSEVVPFNG